MALQNEPIYSKSKSLGTNALWNTTLSVWNALVTFFLTPFLIHSLGVEHYGLYVLVTTISGFMGLMSLGLGEATLRYVAYYAGRNDLAGINRVIGATFSIYAIIIILVCTIVGGFPAFFANFLNVSSDSAILAVSLLRLTSIIFGLTIINNALSSIPQALLRYDITTKVLFALSLVQTCGIVLMLSSGLGVYEIVLLMVFLLSTRALIQVFIIKNIIPGISIAIRPSKKGIKEVFSYGIFNFITYTFYMFQAYSDRLILSMYLNVSAISYLSAPQNLADRAGVLVHQVGAVLVPKFSAVKTSTEQKQLFFYSTWLLITLSVTIFIPMAILFYDFLKLWIDKPFAIQSAFIGQLVAISFINHGATLAAANLYRGIAKPQVISYYSIALGLSILIGNLILIPRFGLAGAGYALLFKPFWGIVLAFFAFRMVTDNKDYWPSILHYLALPLFVSLVVITLGVTLKSHVVIHNWFSFFGIGLIIASITLSTILFVEWICYRSHSMTVYLLSRTKPKRLFN